MKWAVAVSALALLCTAPGRAQPIDNLEKLTGLQGAGTLQPIPQTGPEAEAIKATLAKIKLPPGFKIGLYAIVPGARHMAVGPQGAVTFVGTLKDSVYSVTDRNKDGVADEVKLFAPGLKMTVPNGVCFSTDGFLYIAEQNRVLVYPAAESKYEAPELAAFAVVKQGELIPLDEVSDGHTARTCRIGPDDRLYITLGQPYNVSPKEKIEKYKSLGIGGIVSMKRDGSDRMVFATGLRNSLGLDFNPRDKTLWFNDNQVDGMGDLIPPGEMNHALKAGLDFGFPWYGGGKVRTNEYTGESPPADVVFPEVERDAHAADLGLSFYAGTMFPEKYRGGIFSTQHGSWNRTQPIGARVLFTSLKADGTADKTEVFAEGWLENGAYRGRPLDVQVLNDGSLLVSDDFSGAIYRIAYEQ
jgi:glucose/arabinose dehydrogenase